MSTSNLHPANLKRMFDEIERRLGILERRPSSPDMPLAMREVARPIEVTSDTWQPVHTGRAAQVSNRAIRAYLTLETDPGTTAEVRLRLVGVGASAAKSVPAGATGADVSFDWLHGAPPNNDVTVLIEVRRTGGTGVVRIYPPDAVILSTPTPASTTSG